MRLLYGSQNFGYDLETSDKDWIEFIYPTWDDIVLCKNVYSREYKNEFDTVTKVKDIRCIIPMISKANFNDLQILFSKEKYGCDDLSWFFENKQQLLHMNIKQMWYTNIGYIKSCLKKNNPKDDIRALASIMLLEDVLLTDKVQFCRDELRQYRKEYHTIPNYHNIIEQRLNSLISLYENSISLYKQNTRLYNEMVHEVKRLIKDHIK